jgi:hypothetical protein
MHSLVWVGRGPAAEAVAMNVPPLPPAVKEGVARMNWRLASGERVA